MDRDSHSYILKITKLDQEIRGFDSLLEEIQNCMPEDFEFYERIVNVRDAMYRLKACMRDCVITKFQFGPSYSNNNTVKTTNNTTTATADLRSWFPTRDDNEDGGGII